MNTTTYRVIGVMSGSSLDGLDIAYSQFQYHDDRIDWELLAAETVPYPQRWQMRLSELHYQKALDFSKTHTYFGRYMGELIMKFLDAHQADADFIASHGHTVFHYPYKRVTTQIGDGAAIAAMTGLPVVCDFRTQDTALDGEGTPLAPIADKYLFPDYDFYLNIGGIANISNNNEGTFIAFDICPANQVLNLLAQQRNHPYDDQGDMARAGNIVNDILQHLDHFDYFGETYPKSLNNGWIRRFILPIYLRNPASIEDKLRTACEHIALQVSRMVEHIIKKEGLAKNAYRMLVTGGGAFNTFLMELIQQHCGHHIEVHLPDNPIIKFKEALLIALMGLLRVHNQVNCLSSVTGARYDTIGGAIYQGFKKQI